MTLGLIEFFKVQFYTIVICNKMCNVLKNNLCNANLFNSQGKETIVS